MRTIAVMRFSLALLVLLALAVPACLTVPSVILVAGEDASAPPDRSTVDAPHDAQDARAELADAADALSPSVQPEAATVGDVVEAGATVDVIDAGAADVQPDAGPEDRPAPPLDVQPGAVDVLDAGPGDVPDASADACAGGCRTGEECNAGRCGRWRFALHETIGDADPSDPNALDGVEQRCRTRLRTLGRTGRVCRARDLDGEDLRALCLARSSFGLVLGDPAEVAFRADRGWYVPGCVLCSADAAPPSINDGAGCGWMWSDTLCCAFEARP